MAMAARIRLRLITANRLLPKGGACVPSSRRNGARIKRRPRIVEMGKRFRKRGVISAKLTKSIIAVSSLKQK